MESDYHACVLAVVAGGALVVAMDTPSEVAPKAAIRLEKAGWSNARLWLRLQLTFDLAQARKGDSKIKVKRYEPAAAAL